MIFGFVFLYLIPYSFPYLILALDQYHVNPIIFAFYREWFGSCMMILLALIAVYKYGHSFFIDSSWWIRLFFMGAFSFGNVVGSVYAIKFLGKWKKED